LSSSVKILALERERPGASAADFAPHLKAEAARVWELTQEGIVRERYFHAEEHTAVLILECVDLDEARATLDSLPLMKAGLIEFELIPLAPYTGFARLFVKG
jgi:muconolactone delta-isomerase